MKYYSNTHRFNFTDGFKEIEYPQEFIKYQKGIITIIASCDPQKDGSWFRGKSYELRIYRRAEEGFVDVNVRLNIFDKLRDAIKAADAISNDIEVIGFIESLKLEHLDNPAFFYSKENYKNFSRLGALCGRNVAAQKAA